jgi:hypothetical protein
VSLPLSPLMNFATHRSKRNMSGWADICGTTGARKHENGEARDAIKSIDELKNDTKYAVVYFDASIEIFGNNK